MKYLVTGATGFVGGHIAEALRKRGDEVRTIARPTSDIALLKELGVEIVTGDLLDTAAVTRAVTDVDGVIHCAAMVGDWGPVEEYRRANVDTLRILMDSFLANKKPNSRFVLVSSLGIYPAKDHHGTTEDSPLPDGHIDGYTQTKVEGERLAFDYCKNKGLPLVSIRPGFVYGPRDRTVMPKILANLKRRIVSYFGSRNKKMNNVYVANVVEAVLAALEKPNVIGQAYNITDNICVSKKVFFETICKLANLPKPLMTYPLWFGKAACSMLEGTARLIGFKPFITSARIKFMGLNLDYSIAKAQRELGYKGTVPFDQGMKMTIDWLRSIGKVK